MVAMPAATPARLKQHMRRLVPRTVCIFCLQYLSKNAIKMFFFVLLMNNFVVEIYPVNTKHMYIVCAMLDQRRRRWADVVQMLYKYFVLAGFA